MLNIAHRGASGYAPENTRAAFELAIEMGADAIETDVRLTADGAIVLIHDDTVDRTTDGHGSVADHTLAELRALDAGSWFDPAFAGERIMTLDELIDGILPRIPALIEVKEAVATAPAIAAIQAAGVGERVALTSFLWDAVLEAKRLAPELTVGFLSLEFNSGIIQRCVEHGLQTLNPPIHTLDPKLVAEAHDAGLIVGAWGIVEREQVDRLFATGADGATVNWPDWISDHPRRPGAQDGDGSR
jgi:glycerophosphoryl diester phosphodiesterase